MQLRKKLFQYIMVALGGAIMAFGMYNIHSQANVTEGGILGLTLLLEHWFGWSPSVTSFVLNFLCYALGMKVLGWRFIIYSAVAALGFSGTYAICELWPPLWPQIAELPFLAATLGACFIGVGAGLSVRFGGAPGGDDALAMCAQRLLGVKLSAFYLLDDLVVLALSLSYIPWQRLLFSLYTVILSGQIIDLVARKKTKTK